MRLKPNGKARIIHDLSSPHYKEEKPPGTPLAVNRGIDKTKYPAKMANTKSVLQLLDKVGAPAEFSKIDWQQVRGNAKYTIQFTVNIFVRHTNT